MPEHDSTATVHVELIDRPERPHRLAMDPTRLGELADSMAAEGLHQPIGVQPVDATGRYRLIYGDRRLAAARLLHWTTIPARVYPPDYDPALARASENLQRSDLTPVEEALTVREFLDRGVPIAEVGRLFRRSLAWVHARIELLAWPQDLRDAVHEGRLAVAVADALRPVDHAPYRRELIAEAERTGASARTVAVWSAHYTADRERIVRNAVTIEQLAAERDAFVVRFPCPGCRTEVPYTETRSLRLCTDCMAELDAAVRAAVAAPANGAGPGPRE